LALEAEFRKIRDQFATPEEIDDSPITAPSKRMIDLVPGFEKPLLGSLAALEIGQLAFGRNAHTSAIG
jgi:hypothetical protein